MKLVRRVFILPLLVIIVTVNTSFVDLANNEFTFTGYFGKDQLVQNKKYYCTSQGDSIGVSTCRFYISSMTLSNDQMEWGRLDYKLIDLFDTSTTTFNIPYYSHGDISTVRFYLGIDSTTNVSGVGQGDLDPTKGMYWAWQSGFINLKLEGNSKLCSKSRNEFQYHLGGYAAPNNALQLVELKVDGNGRYNIKVDVEQFFSRTNMKQTSNVMSPSAKAVELSANAAKMFSSEE